jgi:ankyrin repeat protein
MLIAHGADIDEKGIDEASPLQVATTHGHAHMVESLLAADANVDSQGSYGMTALHVAAINDDLKIGRILLNHGADPTLEFNGEPVRPRSNRFRELLDEYGDHR